MYVKTNRYFSEAVTQDMIKRRKYKLVCGVGINDVESNVNLSEVINGKKKTVWVCPYYADWYSILKRCFKPYSSNYEGCSVHKDWLLFSNFKRWVDEQPNRDWQNCEPDKDLLVKGNKCYSPDKVVYIPSALNNFIPDSGKAKGAYMLGVSFEHGSKRHPYRANCMNPFTKKQEYLGLFRTEIEAHFAWKLKKHEHACILADMQPDPRVAKALRERYNKEGIYE